MSNQLNRRIITSALLLLLGSATAWAGPGDIDVNFGLGWSYDAMALLPDDRLMIVVGDRVVRFDANGKIDPTFGDGGEVHIPLPDATPFFDASHAAATPDGGLLIAGYLSDATGTQWLEVVLLRLDRDGHLVTPFGGQGDGFYRPPGMPVGVLVDPAGRILLAALGTPNAFCDGPNMVVRLTPSGVADVTFGENGRAMLGLCVDPALFGVRNDGSIVVGGPGAIVGLDASGAPDPAFGLDGHVSHGLPNEWGRGRLLPDGGILIVGRDSSAMSARTVFTKFDRNGQLDAAFGTGTGSAQLDLGAAFFGTSGSRQSVHDFVITPDAAHLYLQLTVLHADGTTACAGGIARTSLDGTPDVSFGRQGLTCLDYGGFPFSLIASQRNGSPLLQHWLGDLYRLLVDATESPGMLTMVRNRIVGGGEADGTVTVPVVRTAGRDGAVSLSFSTGQGGWLGHTGDIVGPFTTPGSDYQAASGRLDWADGDEGERDIDITILDDGAVETVEYFGITISDPQGGALTLPYGEFVNVAIADDDGAPPTNPTPTTPPTSASGNGGGGSLSWASLLIVSGLLLGRRRHPRWSRGLAEAEA